MSEILFVCAHGNAKSLIASRWFNRLAGERGIQARAGCRALTPENPVPAPIADRLRRDGMEIAGFEARGLTHEDLAGLSRLILIGVEPPAWVPRDGLEVEKWDGIPPASEDYEASRDAMRIRIERLLELLRAPDSPR